MNILQPNETADKFDQVYDIHIAINHLNKAFQDVMSDAERQSTDEYMTKFKVRMSCKQYIKNKPIEWGFKQRCQ